MKLVGTDINGTEHVVSAIAGHEPNQANVEAAVKTLILVNGVITVLHPIKTNTYFQYDKKWYNFSSAEFETSLMNAQTQLNSKRKAKSTESLPVAKPRILEQVDKKTARQAYIDGKKVIVAKFNRKTEVTSEEERLEAGQDFDTVLDVWNSARPKTHPTVYFI